MEDLEKMIKTGMLFLVWICLAFFLVIGGPTMIDLKLRFDLSYTSVAWAISASGFGHFFGAFIGGAFVDLLGHWQDMLITGSQLLAVPVVMTIPLISNAGALWFLFFAMGTTVGITDAGSHRILIKMWREKTPVPMHLIHLGFGIGATAAPLAANDFLAELHFKEPSGNSTVSPPDQQAYTVVKPSRVHLAYVTIGILAAALCTPFIAYSFYKCYQRFRRGDCASEDDHVEEQTKSVMEAIRSIVDPATYGGGSRAYGVFLCILLVAYFMNIVGGEHTLGRFIRTYSIDSAHFSRDEASYLDTTYWASFTAGRIVSSVLAHCVSTRTLLLVTTLLNALMGISFSIFAVESHTTLWTFTILSGLSFGPMYPGYLSYANTHMDISGVVLGLTALSSGVGSMMYLGITGSLYDWLGPRVLLYMVATCCVLMLVIVMLSIVGTYKRADRFSKPLSEDTELLTEGAALQPLTHQNSRLAK